ncbi:colicin immunity domain-containing protein [Peribacillus frigoritolerans]|uniref:colicin immunity domain-containing protein n=1 Tax=Peribacillus frigoritolerans TaxID=450367 RepID=UPI0021A9FB47|nr:colicin immunity domain-containing protein [Peribacillus frigoritolerans]MCT4478264.1 colicin immunity domain-containing protein [Peribacillus frigoritolerans]
MFVNKYKHIMVDFLEGKISADEFQTRYMKNFIKWNDKFDETYFEILNGVFESADCYWHECLPGQETSFEISEQQLRIEINEALIKLNILLDNR